MTKMKKFHRSPEIFHASHFNGIAFIGGAPDDDALMAGKPFAGPVKRLLTQACQMAGIDIDECYLGNVFNEQPPDNDIKNWCAKLEERRSWAEIGYPPVSRGNFLRSAHYYHLERLESEMEKLKPTIIIPLGDIAHWAFGGEGSVMKHRGAISEASMVVPGAKLLPTYHPEMVHRVYKYFPVMVFDLLKAKGEWHTREISYTPRKIIIEPDLDDIRIFLSSISDAEYLSVDIETIPSFRQITCIGFADSIHRAIVVPFCDKRQPDNSYWRTVEEEVEALRLVQELCKKSVVKLGQNFTYDLQWILERWGISVLGYSEDTRLMHHALYPELPKDLGFLGSCYAKEKSWKMYRGSKAEKRDE